jgi:hypothetical protein
LSHPLNLGSLGDLCNKAVSFRQFFGCEKRAIQLVVFKC